MEIRDETSYVRVRLLPHEVMPPREDRSPKLRSREIENFHMIPSIRFSIYIRDERGRGAWSL